MAGTYGRSLLLLTSLGVCLSVVGCPSNSGSPKCTANARQCIDDRVAQVCPSDGSGFVNVACRAGETCTNGTCTSICKSGDRECLDDRVARVCAADGTGWLAEPCPADQACDTGRCVSNFDAATVVPPCQAGTRDCADDRMARVCSPDGTAWITVACQTGEKCVAGQCTFNTGTTCTAHTGQCVNGAAAVCRPDGSGYAVSPCPAGAYCTGSGVCQGVACQVGTRCSGGNLMACADGTGAVVTPCAADQSCADPDPVHGFAACKTKQCNPGLRVCGNKLDTTVDQTKFFSECVSTPDGYKWVTTRCDGYLTCHSSAGVACSSDCLQGQTQCSGAGLVTCGADGTWGVALSCGTQTCGTDSVTGVSRCADVGCEAGQKGVCVDPGQVRLCTNGTLGAPQALVCATGACDHGECKPQCVDGTSNCATLPTGEIGVVTCASGRLPKTLGEVCSSPVTGANRTCVTVSTTKAVCVDLECQTASGLCTSDGKLRVCVDGKLAAVGAAVACPAGEVCVGTACVAADCQAGETKCAGAPLMNAYRSCQAGVFTNSVTFCPTAADAGTGLQSCIDSRDASNLRKALCGLECSPGARKCEIAPSDAGVPPSLLRVCDANGKWGAATACAYGQCAGAEPSAGCQADCLPGDLHCGGTASLHPDLRIPVTNGTQACLASGTWSPTITTCATGQYCRVDPNGVAYGCVECVGSSNQSGAVDLRCAVPDDAGVASAIQECTAGNQWPPTSVSCNGACHSPSGVQPAYCATSGGGTCLGCAQTTCGAYRTACLADPTCVTSFENCLATNHCWDPAAAFFTCVHNCAYYIDQTTSDYHNCLTHMAPPTGCSGGGMCNQN